MQDSITVREGGRRIIADVIIIFRIGNLLQQLSVLGFVKPLFVILNIKMDARQGFQGGIKRGDPAEGTYPLAIFLLAEGPDFAMES